MSVIRITILVSFLILFQGSMAGAAEVAHESNISRISISHGNTRGMPPIYELTLFSDGLVVYHGIKNVSNAGWKKKRIEPQKFREFALEFERINFLTFRDGTLCGMAMDIPLTSVSVTFYGEEKTVRYNWSCDENESLRPLVTQIEETVFSGQWEK